MCDMADGYSAVWNSNWLRARREHKCCACRETVRPGDLYRRTSSLYDGHWDTFKHCARCWNMYETLVDLVDRDVVVDPFLDCGETLDLTAHPGTAYLAFQTPEEAQRYAARAKRRGL